MEKEYTNYPTAQYMKDNLFMARNQEKANLHLVMDQFILAISQMAISTDMEFSNIQMVVNIVANGKMEFVMEMARWSIINL